MYSLKLVPSVFSNESSELKDIVYEELNLDDFPEVNKSKDMLTNEDMLHELKEVKKELKEYGKYSDKDTSFFGY